jgi:hypothetical protein
MGDSLFPQWIDRVRPLAGALVVVVPVYLVAVVYYGGSPRTTDVGYAPKQPVPFSHAVHVGQLKLDCRYCHTNVETGDKPPLGVERDGSTRPRVPSFAKIAIPSTEVCMNCHQRVAPDSPKLQPVRDSAATGQAVPWVRVHDLPDYVYFDHSAHIARGVGCVSCHGRVDQMEVVQQVAPLSMGWCLDCHRNPEPHLRPAEFITRLDWSPGEDAAVLGARLKAALRIQPSTDCSTCHR